LNREERNKYNWERIHRTNVEGKIERLCSICKEWKIEAENFYLRNKSKPEKGYNPECNKCCVKRSQQRYANIPEDVLGISEILLTITEE
jgi:hypothetical protein